MHTHTYLKKGHIYCVCVCVYIYVYTHTHTVYIYFTSLFYIIIENPFWQNQKNQEKWTPDIWPF